MLAIDRFEQADRAALVHERDLQSARVTVAPQQIAFRGVDTRVVGVDDAGHLLLEPAQGLGIAAQVEAARRRRATPAGVVLGERGDGLGVGFVAADRAGVAAADDHRVLGDLGQQGALIELAGDGDRGLDQCLEFALARLAYAHVRAAADRPRQLDDVGAGDASVTAGGACAGQQADLGPAARRGRRHAEQARRAADAEHRPR